MKELTKVFNGVELPIEDINGKEFMIDVSGIAESHGKKVAEWANSKKTQTYIKEVKKTLNVGNPTFKRNLIETQAGKGGYTKIHSKLLIDFARFISPAFAVWCDEFIYNYLTQKKEEELKQCYSNRKICKVIDGWGSARAIAQRSEGKYSERKVKEFAEKLELIKPVIRPTLYWVIQDKSSDLVQQKYPHSTPYYKVDDMLFLMDSYTGEIDIDSDEEDYEDESYI